MTRPPTKQLLAYAWVVGGLVLTATLVTRDGAWMDRPLLTLALTAMVMVSVNYQLHFRLGGTKTVIVSPTSAPMAFAAVFLSPAAVMALCIVGFLPDVPAIRRGIKWQRLVASGVFGAFSAGASSVVSHAAFGLSPAGPELLPAALLAASMLTICEVSQYAAAFGLDVLRQFKVVGALDIATTTMAIVLAGAYVESPLIALAVLALFQAIVYVVSRVATSESLHRAKNEHLRGVFSRMVPAHVADQLAEGDEEVRLGGEQRDISVLFCDIRGFTSWSEKVEPEVVIIELNALLRGLSGAVMDADGTLDKYTGDGLMAFWGAPLAQPDHAQLACHAAVDMLGRLDECNREREANGLPPFAIGIGVHSGKAVVGNIGHEDRLDYTAIGDTVNLSARLEAATKEVGSVLLLSAATRELLGPSHESLCIPKGGISVKGRTQPVDVYTIAGDDSVQMMGAWTEAAGRAVEAVGARTESQRELELAPDIGQPVAAADAHRDASC